MTDHEKLREAIKVYRERVERMGLSAFNDEFMRQSDLIVAAAESTLPKTKMVWEVCATDCLSEIIHNEIGALNKAQDHLREGRVVTISRLEIPA